MPSRASRRNWILALRTTTPRRQKLQFGRGLNNLAAAGSVAADRVSDVVGLPDP